MLKRIGILLVIYFVFATIGVGYLFFYTPFPLRVLSENVLPPGRVEFIGMSGGFIPGMAMSQMIVRDEKRGFEFVAEGIHFRYASPADLFKGRFVVDTFTVDKVVTKMSSKFYERAKNSVNPLAPPEAVVVQVQAPDPSVPVLDPNSREAKARRLLETAVHKLFTDPDAFVKAVGIHELRVSNSEVQYQKSDGAIEYERLKEFRVADLLYHPSTHVFRLEEFVYSTPKQDFRMKGITLANSEPRIEKVSGTIRKAYDPERIRNDLDFEINVEGGTLKDAEKLKVSLVALGGKIRATIGPNLSFFASFFDLTAKEVYAVPFPITHLNLEATAPNVMMLLGGGISTKGDFKIGETTFRFGEKGLQASAMVGKHLFTVAYQSGKSDGKPLVLRSTYTESSQDNLAFLYYGARYVDLEDAKKTSIDTDLAYFDRGKPPAVKAIAAPSKKTVRRPASVKPRRGRR